VNRYSDKYNEGSTVYLDDDAVDNYGEVYRGAPLTITGVSHNREEHPGYDSALEGMALYEISDADTGKEIGFSVYEYELR
jgi:hypothetical protein